MKIAEMTENLEDVRQTPWLLEEALVLASASPARKMLLQAASIYVDVIEPNIDERRLESQNVDLNPRQLAMLLAGAKSSAVSEENRGRIVVGADQTLEINGKLLHKPKSNQEAIQHLHLLSGQTHTLHSAAAIARDGQIVESFYDSATMTVRTLNEKAILTYVDIASNHKILSSVGAYQIERLGIHLFSDIKGHHSTILGLPLLLLLQKFRKMGLLSF